MQNTAIKKMGVSAMWPCVAAGIGWGAKRRRGPRRASGEELCSEKRENRSSVVNSNTNPATAAAHSALHDFSLWLVDTSIHLPSQVPTPNKNLRTQKSNHSLQKICLNLKGARSLSADDETR
jgi:hypothetical protein